ncbi:MAG: chemotaxis-specific protein-glutamate methyltransferase CheB [Thermoanaerobaculia bacterium]
MQLNTPPRRPERTPSIAVVARILVVDDSTFVRRTLRKIFQAQPGFTVIGEAGDGAEAIERIVELNPDVVTLDVQMPGMDGFTALKAIGHRWPNLPVIVLASSAQNGAGAAFEALSLGAFEFIDKSRCGSMDFHLLGTEIVTKVRAALVGRVPFSERTRSENTGISNDGEPDIELPTDVRMVCVGASTGGPQAIQLVLDRIPATFPFPLAIVQHMPVGFTGAFAERLNHSSPLEVKEARHGDVFHPGRALIAPAGRHLMFQQGLKGITAALSDEPSKVSHIPSVDVLFSSAAESFGASVIAVIMTGMGSDGRDGARRLAAEGAFVIAEAEKSCAVYGMPKAVVEAGLADACWTSTEIAERLAHIRGGRGWSENRKA